MGISSRLWFDLKQAKQISLNVISKGFPIPLIRRLKAAESKLLFELKSSQVFGMTQ